MIDPRLALEQRPEPATKASGREISNLASGPVGRRIKLTDNLFPLGLTLLNGFARVIVVTDSDPDVALIMQLRIIGSAGGPFGELARGQVPPWRGAGPNVVYDLPAVITPNSLAQKAYLELFIGYEDEAAPLRAVTLDWSAFLGAGYRF